MRYKLVYLVLILALGPFSTGEAAQEQSGSTGQPNILLILVDDLGKEWISAYGAEEVETPNIDALASTGVKFEIFYAMPQCTPTRVALLTGKYPHTNGWGNHWDVPRWGVGYFDWKQPENTTFANLLRDAGYATFAAGKWQINDFRLAPDAMAKHGFDDWCMWTGYESGTPGSGSRYRNPYLNTPEGSRTYSGEFGPDVFTDRIIEFLQQHQDQPMLIYYAMVLTHDPFIATPLDPEAKTDKERHIAMVRYTDHIVGRLVNTLDELGLRDNTLIFFTTDNGTNDDIVGRRNGVEVRGAKQEMVEAGTAVPFIVNGPGIVPAGSTTDALSDITDMLPTFGEFAGTKPPEDLKIDGISLAPLLRGQTDDTPREYILSMGGGGGTLDEQGVRNKLEFDERVLRDKQYKVWVDADREIERLHDMRQDPREETNLVDSQNPEHQAALEKFRRIIAGMPETDARPAYEPRAANAWDREM